MKRIYIAGPMTGYPQYNFPEFIKMAALLRAMGFDVVSPAELDDPADRAAAMASPDGERQTVESFGKSWGDFLARDVKIIADESIDAIVVLPGWENSSGARLETFVGHLSGARTYVLGTIGGFVSVARPGLVLVDPEVLYSAWAGVNVFETDELASYFGE